MAQCVQHIMIAMPTIMMPPYATRQAPLVYSEQTQTYQMADLFMLTLLLLLQQQQQQQQQQPPPRRQKQQQLQLLLLPQQPLLQLQQLTLLRLQVRT